MPNFLFWNINGKPIQELIAAAALHFDVDVLLLAENRINPVQILTHLNQAESTYSLVRNLCPRISIYTKFDSGFLHPLDESERVSINRVRLPARKEILLATAHLPSKREFTAASQAQECMVLSQRIIAAEQSVGHERTLFMGDLNVNPFEDGMVAAGALHAVMTRDTAERVQRTVQGQRYRFFYNPMWSHLGDGRTNRPPGTFYYEKAEHVVYFWNIFDQVLLRPELAAAFEHENLTVVSKVGTKSLLGSNGRPDARIGSDHLPILLKLEF
jgi:endonuclease/exonuclease/phosphatase (EEP) superfamily protein YafD